MPRKPRRHSISGYMHIVVRGIGKQILFETAADYYFYLAIIRRYSRETDVEICAYCLMDNHVHLLIYDPSRQVSLFMKKVGVCYSIYYNKKYERTGHLFQNRYHSEVVEDESYFLTVFRYILQNPEKAGICRTDEYGWSSFAEYDDPDSFLKLSLIRSALPSREEYTAFVCTSTKQTVLPRDGSPRRGDEYARRIIRECLGVESGTALQDYGRVERNNAIRLLKQNGLSERQISRLTGISRPIIHKL